MFCYLSLAAAYLVCASAVAVIAAGNFVVEVREPRLTDPGNGRGTCCRESSSSKIYQAVLQETVEFEVNWQEAADASTAYYTTFIIEPTSETGCYSQRCLTNSCPYKCKLANKFSINDSECYVLFVTSRSLAATYNLSICVYNRNAEPLKVLSPPAASLDMGSLTLKYEVGGYPLPASITVTCDEQSDGGTTHQSNASISFIQDNVAHYDIQLDNVAAGELRCRVAALSEFYNFTSETELINVTSASTVVPACTFGTATGQFISHEVTAVTTKADASILLRSEPTVGGTPKEVIVGLSTAAVVLTVVTAIAVGVAMWRRSATRRQVTLIRNENYNTTIVNNDNRQTIVNNYQHNVDIVSHSGVFDINGMLLAWEDTSSASPIDHSIHGQCLRPHESNG